MAKRALTAKDLDHIDDLVAFCAKNSRNAELMQMFAAFMSVAQAQGGAEVFGRRLQEARRAKRDAAK